MPDASSFSECCGVTGADPTVTLVVSIAPGVVAKRAALQSPAVVAVAAAGVTGAYRLTTIWVLLAPVINLISASARLVLSAVAM